MTSPVRPQPSWEQPPIADYAFLSDCHSAALVDRGGSVPTPMGVTPFVDSEASDLGEAGPRDGHRSLHGPRSVMTSDEVDRQRSRHDENARVT